MTAQFVWQDSYNIGIASIDQAHQQLFRIINKLYNYREQEKDDRWICEEGIKFFKGHALKHFSEEETYMTSVGYGGLAQHQRLHKGFRENTLPALEQELERSNYAPDAVDHFLGVCAGWLIGHTLTEDLAITGGSVQRWESLMPGEEQEALKKAIVQLVFDLFHLESKMISDVYSGEKFGRGVYYRLSFAARGGEKYDVIMAFEEKLLINTVGKVLGIETNRLDSMLVHASRYTARQFVGRVMECFPTLDGYELKEENLLSYEEFQKAFEREKPQASLLFDTGGGYFSYCTIAPNLPTQGVGTPLEAANAMSEVEHYLAQRAQQEACAKPRILVVDDSMAIRQNLKHLLETDYDVSQAGSGVAAIRAITLNRPDLVLLDYEMPVCDGRQTLEMLRSEESFADVPVIFLTGRSDPESVRNVMSLKPAGYLLKKFKPDEIKRKIDGFFAKKKA